MSRYFEMTVFIDQYDVAKIEAIQKAATAQWPFEDWNFCSGSDDVVGGMQSSAQSQLCGGEAEEEFVDRLAVAIWQANGRYCEVSVDAVYLESLPYESYLRGESDYKRLMPRKGVKPL
jgi:hypothetical protein